MKVQHSQMIRLGSISKSTIRSLFILIATLLVPVSFDLSQSEAWGIDQREHLQFHCGGLDSHGNRPSHGGGIAIRSPKLPQLLPPPPLEGAEGEGEGEGEEGCSILDSKPSNLTTLMLNGPAASHLDIVIIPDGYTAAEQSLFEEHIKVFFGDLALGEYGGIFEMEPFKSYRPLFNIHRMEIPSEVSGISVPGARITTPFDARISCPDVDDQGQYREDRECDCPAPGVNNCRLMGVNYEKVKAVLPCFADQTIVLSNTTFYGASGHYGNSTTVISGGFRAADPQEPWRAHDEWLIHTLAHELGHAIAGLGDEYTPFVPDTPEACLPDEEIEDFPNVSTTNNPLLVKWSHWLNPETPIDPGIYDQDSVEILTGAQRCWQHYRPTNHSKMRYHYGAFNPPSVEAFLEEIYKVTGTVDDRSAEDEPVHRDTELFVLPLSHLAGELEIQWFVGDDPIIGANGTHFRPSDFIDAPDGTIVKAIVTDPTDWARSDRARAQLTETFTWTIREAPRVVSVAVNTNIPDPPSIEDRGPQPSSWSTQQSDIRNITIAFSEPVTITPQDIQLLNLGINGLADEDTLIDIEAQHFTVEDEIITLSFDHQELPEGSYAILIADSVIDLNGNALDGNADGFPGDPYLLMGSLENGLYRLTGDFNGDGGVSIFDYPTFAYWFSKPIPVAPEYLDLNSDGGVSIFDFPIYSERFGKSIVFE